MKNIKGYTLIELSISLTIMALLIAGGLTFYSTQLERKNLIKTNEKINIIEKSLKSFMLQYGYLPCPANGLALEGDNSNGNFGDSSIAPVYHNINHVCTEDGVGDNAAGMLPVRQLGLDDDYAYDGWGRKFTYRIAKGMGNAVDFANDEFKGDISVADINGNEKTSINDPYPNNFGAAYVIISYGPNGLGSWGRNSSTTSTMPNTDSIEHINARHLESNPTYLQHPRSSIFDDIVVFKQKNQLLKFNVNTAPFKIPQNICSDAISILKQGRDIVETINPAAIGSQIYKTANIMNKFCQGQDDKYKNKTTICNMNPRNFTPTNSNLWLWLDAMDPLNNGTIPAHNTPITSWMDKSGLGRNATMSPAAPLIYYNDASTPTPFIKNAEFPHGKPALYFNGTNQRLAVNLSMLSSNSHTIFAVQSPASDGYFMGTGNSCTLNHGLVAGYGYLVAPTQTYRTFKYAQLNNDLIIPIPFRRSHALGTLYIMQADTVKGRSFYVRTIEGLYDYLYSDDKRLPNSGNHGFIGGQISCTPNYFRGYIAEIIVYNKALNLDEIKTIEGYLVRKWFTGTCR